MSTAMSTTHLKGLCLSMRRWVPVYSGVDWPHQQRRITGLKDVARSAYSEVVMPWGLNCNIVCAAQLHALRWHASELGHVRPQLAYSGCVVIAV
jgi:hypothetical protein